MEMISKFFSAGHNHLMRLSCLHHSLEIVHNFLQQQNDDDAEELFKHNCNETDYDQNF
jgi:hypothetical protein